MKILKPVLLGARKKCVLAIIDIVGECATIISAIDRIFKEERKIGGFDLVRRTAL